MLVVEVLDHTRGKTWDRLCQDDDWLETDPLVAKPDQLIKRRGKAGLLTVNKTLSEAKEWILESTETIIQ